MCSSRVKTNNQLRRVKSTFRVQRAVFASKPTVNFDKSSRHVAFNVQFSRQDQQSTSTNQADISRSTYSSRVKASKLNRASKGGSVNEPASEAARSRIPSFSRSRKKQEARSKKQKQEAQVQEGARARTKQEAQLRGRSTVKNEV